MANGMILRGEVYWVSVDDSVGSEIQTGRTAVIISGDRANEKLPTVIVAYTSTAGFGNHSAVTVNFTGKPERVLCNQVRTIDKQRLTRYVGKLTEAELKRVSGGLAISMCLRTDGAFSEDIFDKDEGEEVVALKAELEMWKRSYDMAMTQLVELKVSSDIAMRMARRMPEPVVEEPPIKEVEIKVLPPKPEPPKQPEPPKEPEETERVEINTCTAEDLKKCGCTEVVAKTIIAGRPYMDVEDLRKIPGITSVGFGILKHKVCCIPVVEEKPVEEETPVVEPVKVTLDDKSTLNVPEEPVTEVKKVNINTATAKEIMEHLGISRFYPSRIVAHRNKNGKFVDLEELKMVEGLSKDFYDKYKDLLTIGEPEAVVVAEKPEAPKAAEEVPVEKVNINTATAGELHIKLDLSMTVCYSITGVRKRNGLYKSIEELRHIPRFTESHWEKCKDMVTVGEIEPKDEEPKSDKVNINTASMRDLMDVGFEKRAAALIVNERKKFGRFRSVDDLADIPEITGKILRKLRDKLEV